MSTPKENEWLTLSDVAKALGVHEGTVRRWADAGRLPFFRTPGGHRRFLASDVSLFVHQGHYPGNRSVEHIETQVLSVVRNEISQHARSQSWHPYYDSERSSRRKDTGRRLVGLLVHYISQNTNRDQYLNEAKEMMRDYGREAHLLGVNLYDTVQAYLFFRRSLNEAVVASAQGDDAHSPQLIERMNQFWDDLLLAMIEGYTQPHSTSA